MVRAAALFAVLLLPALARAEGARDFVTVSPNTEWAAEQKAKGEGCRLEVKRGETVGWAADRCFGEKGDRHFLSNDGRKLLVVYTFPKNPVLAAVGAELYEAGEKRKSFPVGQFVKSVKPLVMARTHFYWVEGELGQAGLPPGFSADGSSVELNTLDGRRYVLGFDGSVKGPPQKVAKAAKRGAAKKKRK